jgi:hypothetical protein
VVIKYIVIGSDDEVLIEKKVLSLFKRKFTTPNILPSTISNKMAQKIAYEMHGYRNIQT